MYVIPTIQKHAENNRYVSCTKYPRPLNLLNRWDASWSPDTDYVLK